MHFRQTKSIINFTTYTIVTRLSFPSLMGFRMFDQLPSRWCLLLPNSKTVANFVLVRGRLGPKSLYGNRFYKGHRDIAKKPHITYHVFKKPKCLNFFFIKASHFVQNASHYWKKPPFLFKCFKKAASFLKQLLITLKKPHLH
jgi:hypothetical protein